ncbi:MAG: VanZ family protein [bacterium]|nr:VanZ family protein [bacterium]MDY4634864.1 VanZ family protein [Candidatus Limivicinus sp.]
MKASVRKRWNIILGLLVLLTLAFIWGNSLLPRTESQEISRGLLAELCAALEHVGMHLDPQNDHWLRKLAHFGEFGMLGAELGLLLCLNRRQSVQGFVNCAFAGLAVAVTDEALQLISNRGSQVQDVLLDFAGFLTGLLLCGLLCGIIGRKRPKNRF